MAYNRLFIYDPEGNRAICIAKGYSSGWLGGDKTLDEWFDEKPEYNPDITRMKLVTENDMPENAKITWGANIVVQNRMGLFRKREK